MGLEIKELKRKDYRKAIDFASRGMHFDWYSTKRRKIRFDSSYYFYSELIRATDVIAAYENKELRGVLLASISGKKRVRCNPFIKLIINLLDHMNSDSRYERANNEMLSSYLKNYRNDGELLFLAVDPESKGKGTGTLLLEELTRRAKGKRIFLYTDSGCNFRFYEHRGFIKAGEKDIRYDYPGRSFILNCLLYTKVL